MTVRRLAEKQPESFAFSEVNREWAEWRISLYPPGRQASAVISLLWRAQEQEGWVTEPAIEAIAVMLGMPKIRVLEVATFYTMFHLEPVGKIAHLQVCGTTPCWLRGANDIKEVCRKRINHEQFHLSEDGNFSWEEVECIGACVNAPVVQINADLYEDLTAESLEALIDNLAAGRPVKPGPQIDRQFSAPEGGPTSLMSINGGPTASSGTGISEPQAPIEAARPVAAVETPSDPTGAASQAAEKAEDGQSTKEKREEKVSEAGSPEVAAPAAALSDDDRPEAIAAAREGKPDDLRRISGVGPKIESILHELGIYHFDQIAAWGPRQVAWVDEKLQFKGRIDRENWIEQARTLAAESGRSGSA